MKHQFDSATVRFTLADDGTVSFVRDGIQHYTLQDAQADNVGTDGEVCYSAPLFVKDEDGDDEQVGRIMWELIDPDCVDASDACDWSKFDIYM